MKPLRQNSRDLTAKKQMTIDIIIHRSDTEATVKIWVPEETKPLWRVAASRTRNFLGQPHVSALSNKRIHKMNQKWTAAQIALDRLVFMPGQAFFEFDEAHHCLSLIGATALYQQQKQMPWQSAKMFVKVMAEIAHWWIPPRPVWAPKKSEKSDPAIISYQQLRRKVEKGIQTVSVAEIHEFWKPMETYRGQDKMILGERKRLAALCRSFEIIVQRLL